MLDRANGVILGLAIVIAALAGGWQWHLRASPVNNGTDMTVGTRGPDLQLLDLQGHPHQLSEYRGKRVLLNFWASWCLPCLDETPQLDAAQKRYGEKLLILGVAQDNPAATRRWLARHPVNYLIMLGRLDPPSSPAQWGDAQNILPYSVLLDPDGRVLATRIGNLLPGQLEQWLTTP